MKNKLLLLATTLLIAVCSLFPGKAKANHATGGELIYVHLGDSAYQFILKFYRDCRGPDAPGDFTLCVFNTCTNQQFTIPMPKWSGTLPPDNRANGSVVSPGCADVNTSCDQPAGNLPGYREWWYTCVIPALPFHCNYWRFGVITGTAALCCRNSTTNLVGTPSFYLETTFNSLYTWENSSPYYSVKPVPYVCLGQPFSFNNGALDVDGDSLWSNLMNPLQTANCSAAPSNCPMQTLTPPLNFTNNPFQTNNSFVLNGGNGQFSFTSGTIGAGVLTMKTREFRTKDTVPTYEIGFIMRDVQVQTISCSTVPPKVDTVSINPLNGIFLNGKAYGCIGQPLEFCYMVTSTDTDAVLKLSDNLDNISTMPGATITYTDQGTDTVIGCFSWTPTINDVGPHSFISLIKDSTCDPPGILFNYATTIDLEIFGPVEASPDTNVCLGEPAFLGVKGGGDYVWTVLSGTPNSLSNPNIPNPVANPTAPTTYVVTSTLNSFCKNYTTDTVNIDVLTGPVISGQPDDTTCPAQEVQLDLGLVKDPNGNYNISWTPATGLSATNIENPVVNIKTSETYYATISSNVNRCRTFDTVFIDVLTGMVVENPDTAICLGQAIDIRGSGDSRYLYTWESKQDQNAQYSNPGAVITTIQPADTGKYSYVLTASYFKCLRDSITDVKITTEPNPTAIVNEDATLCYGDTMQLEAIVDPSSYGKYVYSWTPGAMLDFPDRKNPIFSAINEGTVTLNFVVTTPEAGCTATDQVVLEVYAADFLTVPNDTAICPGDTIALAMTIQPGAKFYWLPDLDISSISSENPRVWPVADQSYKVFGIDSFGCFDTGTVNITVRPRAIIDMPDSVVIYPGESYRMDPGGNCLYYSWFPPLGLSDADVSNPMVSPKVNTRYIVTGRTETGCTVTDSLNVLIKTDGFLNLPNAFTPGKRDNGTLKIVRRGIANLKTFAVYNRWGAKVFETSDINEGWDGTFNGEVQPMGVYIYTIEAVAASGQTITKQGNVTLLR